MPVPVIGVRVAEQQWPALERVARPASDIGWVVDDVDTFHVLNLVPSDAVGEVG